MKKISTSSELAESVTIRLQGFLDHLILSEQSDALELTIWTKISILRARLQGLGTDLLFNLRIGQLGPIFPPAWESQSEHIRQESLNQRKVISLLVRERKAAREAIQKWKAYEAYKATVPDKPFSFNPELQQAWLTQGLQLAKLSSLNQVVQPDVRNPKIDNSLMAPMTPPTPPAPPQGPVMGQVLYLTDNSANSAYWESQVGLLEFKLYYECRYLWTLKKVERFLSGGWKSLLSTQDSSQATEERKKRIVAEGKVLDTKNNKQRTILQIAGELAKNYDGLAPETIAGYLRGHGIGRRGRPATPVK